MVTPKFTRETRDWAVGKNCLKIFPCPSFLLPDDLVLLLVPNLGPRHKEV